MIALGWYAIPNAIECVEQGQEDMPFLSESGLFATPYGKLRFPNDLSNVRSVEFGGSKRLEQFLGR
jgi:hypothetical protein